MRYIVPFYALIFITRSLGEDLKPSAVWLLTYKHLWFLSSQVKYPPPPFHLLSPLSVSLFLSLSSSIPLFLYPPLSLFHLKNLPLFLFPSHAQDTTPIRALSLSLSLSPSVSSFKFNPNLIHWTVIHVHTRMRATLMEYTVQACKRATEGVKPACISHAEWAAKSLHPAFSPVKYMDSGGSKLLHYLALKMHLNMSR